MNINSRNFMKKKWKSSWTDARNSFRAEFPADEIHPFLLLKFQRENKEEEPCQRWSALRMIRALDVYESKIYGFLSMKIAGRGEANDARLCTWEMLRNHWFRKVLNWFKESINKAANIITWYGWNNKMHINLQINSISTRHLNGNGARWVGIDGNMKGNERFYNG